MIREAGARTTLYMTWARSHAPQTQEAITSAYRSIGEEIGADVIPAGVAWQQFMREHQRPVLHDRDGSHPTLAGSYLAACVAFAVLFDQTPMGLRANVDGLSSEDAKLLQKTAARAFRPAHLRTAVSAATRRQKR